MNIIGDMMDKHIEQAKRMLAANETLIAENQIILNAQARVMESKRFETRVLKDDGFGPAPKGLDNLTGARIAQVDDEHDIIILEIDFSDRTEQAYTSKDEPHVLRWSSNQVPVLESVCKRMGWPWMDEQKAALKKDFQEDMRRWINGP